MHVDVIRSFKVLNTYISRTSAQLTEIDVKKLFDADWMSVRLKEKIMTLIKLMFRQTAENQNMRNHKNKTLTLI